MNDDKTLKFSHNVILEDRTTLTISGVSDVDSFDDRIVVVYTDMGELTVRGSELHINSLNLEVGELRVSGKIQSMGYADDVQKNTGMLARLFK